ncbi:MAG: hypothetical protein WCS71_06235 [Sphaerochaetaceae bacterium]
MNQTVVDLFCGAGGSEPLGRRLMISLVDFASLVQEMREAQQSYFTDRTRENLVLSKTLEAKVDKMVREIKSGQEQLF